MKRSKIANPASSVPQEVERYFAETKAKQPQITDAKAWAIAWSRFCKYTDPGSSHCRLARSDYFAGRRGVGSDAPMPNPVGTRVPVARIVMAKQEGQQPPEGDRLTIEAGEIPDVWKAADKVLWQWSLLTPQGGGYDKTRVLIIWQDGSSFVDRIDLNRKWGAERRTLSGHVKHAIAFMAGVGAPARFTPSQYDDLLKTHDAAHMRSMWDTLDLGDAPFEPGPVKPTGHNDPWMDARRLAAMLNNSRMGHAQAVVPGSPLAAVATPGSVVMYPDGERFDADTKRRLDALLGLGRLAAVTDQVMLVAEAHVRSALSVILDASNRWGSPLTWREVERMPLEPGQPPEPEPKVPQDRKEQIALIRAYIRAVAPKVSVTMGHGTVYGWVDIRPKGHTFTAEESQALKSLGLNPGSNFANIPSGERDVFLRRWMRQSRPRVMTKAQVSQVLHKPPSRLPTLDFGSQYENPWWRVVRMSNVFRVTELVNAGKRGKAVREIVLLSKSHQHRATTDEASRELMQAAQQPDFAVMEQAAARAAMMPPGYEMSQRKLKGIEVTPFGDKYEARGVDFAIRVEPRDFTARGTDVNESCVTSANLTAARKAHAWLMSIREDIPRMTMRELNAGLSQRGIEVRHYCGVD
jgi:hypothetical protein